MIPANKPLKTEPKKSSFFFYHCLGLAKDYFHSLKREMQKETNRLLWAKLHIMLNHPPTPTSPTLRLYDTILLLLPLHLKDGSHNQYWKCL